MDKNKKNIGIFIKNLMHGGIERIASNVILGLSEKYNVFLIVYNDNIMDYPYTGKIISLNEKEGVNNLFIKLINFFRKIRKLKNIVRENNIYKVISFGENPNTINILANKKKKSILTIHSFKSIEEKTRESWIKHLYPLLIRFLYNRSGKIITVSKSVGLDLKRKFKIDPKIIKPIYNSFFIKDILKQSKESLDDSFFNQPDTRVIITVSRICPTKAIWHIIRVFNQVLKYDNKIRLVILGESSSIDYKNELTKLIIGYNIVDYVKIIDFQINPYQYLKNSDLYLSTSILEGFGNVIIESMACGLPVIHSDCKAGPREILAPDTDIDFTTSEIELAEYGILVPPCEGIYMDYKVPLTKNEKITLNAILLLLTDRNLMNKYSKRGIERSKDFDNSKLIKKYIKVIEDIVS